MVEKIDPESEAYRKCTRRRKRIKRANWLPNCADSLVATILAAAPWACRKRRAQLVYTQLAVDPHRAP